VLSDLVSAKHIGIGRVLDQQAASQEEAKTFER
jgi:hypothetical protein